jgi:hypothetical protein
MDNRMSMSKEHDDSGQRCSGCQEFKEYSDFYRSKDKKTARKSACKQCQRERMNAYYKTPHGRKMKQEKSWLENGLIGMTVERYEAMLVKQDGGCSICKKTVNKNGTRLCVDHDHETGLIRGLLCHDCNTSLGKLDDSLDLLYKAVEYLEEHEMSVV